MLAQKCFENETDQICSVSAETATPRLLFSSQEMAGYGQDDQGFYTGSYAEQGGFDMSGSGNQYVQDP